MAIYNIYSKGKKGQGDPEIYVYDSLSRKLRTQIYHIIRDAVGVDTYSSEIVREFFKYIRGILLREYGTFYLVFETSSEEDDVLHFLLQEEDTKKVLDVTQLCFQLITTYIKDCKTKNSWVKTDLQPEEAISDLNTRFKENGVGYVFESNKIIRVDSTHLHNEITKPVLKLLSNARFANANEEYLKAHEHYRHGRNKEALTECLKAFESTMKIILKAKGWVYDEKDTASKLIKACFENGLVPPYLQSKLPALKAVLESGVPTVRNSVGGHGQGAEKKEADDELVRYAFNLTGSNIIFLVELSGLNS